MRPTPSGKGLPVARSSGTDGRSRSEVDDQVPPPPARSEQIRGDVSRRRSGGRQSLETASSAIRSSSRRARQSAGRFRASQRPGGACDPAPRSPVRLALKLGQVQGLGLRALPSPSASPSSSRGWDEACQVHDQEPDYEEHGAGGSVGEGTLKAQKPDCPAGGTGHALKKERDAERRAGEAQYEATHGVDELERGERFNVYTNELARATEGILEVPPEGRAVPGRLGAWFGHTRRIADENALHASYSVAETA